MCKDKNFVVCKLRWIKINLSLSQLWRVQCVKSPWNIWVCNDLVASFINVAQKMKSLCWRKRPWVSRISSVQQDLSKLNSTAALIVWSHELGLDKVIPLIITWIRCLTSFIYLLFWEQLQSSCAEIFLSCFCPIPGCSPSLCLAQLNQRGMGQFNLPHYKCLITVVSRL